MDLRIKNKCAFISGSTAGIGYATARQLALEGASVILNGRTMESVNAAVQKMSMELPMANISGAICDFSDRNQVHKLLGKLDHVDILINNVGIYKAQSFYETSDEQWYQQIEVNIMSGMRLSKYLLPKMMDRNWGRIIFISSECATLVPEDLIAYSMTKGALLSLSRGLAQLTKGSEVTVNVVMPGSTLSEGAESFLKDAAKKENKSVELIEQEFFTNVRTSSLIQRFASVEEVSHMICFLSSPLAAATNGATIKVDGGSTGGIL